MIEHNLDRLCAKYGYRFCQGVWERLNGKGKTVNHLTKSLGVLQENGVYAFFLYQPARESKNKEGQELAWLAAELLNQAGISPFAGETGNIDARQALELVRRDRDGLATNLDNLLLAKRLLQQALIYARYHAKALPGGE